MSTNLKNRIKNIQDKVSPPKYKRIEDIIQELDLEKNIAKLTDDERQTLKELRSLPIHPELVATFEKLASLHLEGKRTKNDQK